MCGSLLYHFLVAMTSYSYVDIQMILFVNAYDVGRECIIVTNVFYEPQYLFFILMAL